MYIIHVVLIRRPIYVLLTIFEQSLDFFINSLNALECHLYAKYIIYVHLYFRTFMMYNK